MWVNAQRYPVPSADVYFDRGIARALAGIQLFGSFGLAGTDSKAGSRD